MMRDVDERILGPRIERNEVGVVLCRRWFSVHHGFSREFVTDVEYALLVVGDRVGWVVDSAAREVRVKRCRFYPSEFASIAVYETPLLERPDSRVDLSGFFVRYKQVGLVVHTRPDPTEGTRATHVLLVIEGRMGWVREATLARWSWETR